MSRCKTSGANTLILSICSQSLPRNGLLSFNVHDRYEKRTEFNKAFLFGTWNSIYLLGKGGKALQKVRKSDKLIVKDGWITCPVCGRNHRLIRIMPETTANRLPVYCRTCRSEIILDIDKGQSVKRQSQ